MDYIKAFIVGGLICVCAQILMEKTKLMPGRIMVILVCTGAILGALQIYEPFWILPAAGHRCLLQDLVIICGRVLKRQLITMDLSDCSVGDLKWQPWEHRLP